MKQHLLSIVLMSFALTVFGQEVERELMINFSKAEQHKKEQQFEKRHQLERGGETSLSLPFFDDFATYSLPTNDPEIPASMLRWADTSAYVNCTFPINPPTIGVATLDGLDRTGYPYDFITDSYGPADTLTSLPINLEGLSADDNVYLTFFYQGGGRGNSPDAPDSLVVEFFAPIGGENPWFHQWSIPGAEHEEFQQVFIPIDQDIFLQDGFQFRFRNYSTLTGNLDHWHLDYVLVNNNIDPENFDFFEVAFVECPNTMLQDLTSMPWTHFQTNPTQFMRTTTSTLQRNLSTTQADNVTSGYRIEYEGDIEDYQNDFSIVVVGPESFFTTDYAVNSAPNNFVFDDTVSDTTATFNVSFYADNIGILSDEKVGVPDNDSLVFQQVFQNYYSYDDGSAESAWGLNVAGGKAAVKYNVVTPDTLLGVFIHWTPFQEDNSNESFNLRVWNDDGGVPGDELVDNFAFLTPYYYNDGYNVFTFYEFEETIEVEGPIYVGFNQNGSEELYVGLDKNTNTNPTRLFFQLGLGAEWTQSSIEGSVMIRPVFKAGMTNVWNNIEEQAEVEFNVYPVPFQDQLNIAPEFGVGSYNAQVLDMNGRIVEQSNNLFGSSTIDLSHLAPGVYLLQVMDQNSQAYGRKRIIKR